MISWLKLGLWRRNRDTTATRIPIGGLMPSLHSFYGMPLPRGWVPCNGQVLNDPESLLHGQTIPDLNGEAATVIGASTGLGTFVGSNASTIAVANLPTNSFVSSSNGLHTHENDRATGNTANAQLLELGSPLVQTLTQTPAAGTNTGAHTHTTQLNAGPQTALDNRQRSLRVRWIMRTR